MKTLQLFASFPKTSDGMRGAWNFMRECERMRFRGKRIVAGYPEHCDSVPTVLFNVSASFAELSQFSGLMIDCAARYGAEERGELDNQIKPPCVGRMIADRFV